MNRKLIGFLVACLLVLMPVGLVGAANTADITVNATPAYVSISCNHSGYAWGVIVESTVTNTSASYFGITNDSSIQTDHTIAVTTANWTGGDEWVHSDTCTPGVATAGLKAQRTGQSWVIVKYASPNYIYENCPADEDYVFALSLHAPTTLTDAALKEITVRVTAVSG